MKTFLLFLATCYGWIIKLAEWIGQPLFLLAVRLYWGWQFHETGLGKLTNIAKVTEFFKSLGIPYPSFNAHLAGCTECFGGLLLLIGLASRIVAVPLIVTMIVAYITAFPDVVKHIISKPDDFVSADPFLFMMTAIIVLLFGPGPLSVDGLIALLLKLRKAKQTGAAGTPAAAV